MKTRLEGYSAQSSSETTWKREKQFRDNNWNENAKKVQASEGSSYCPY